MIATLKATMRAFYRAEAPASGGRVIECDGLTAFVTPSAPTQSIVNGVLFDDVAALGEQLPQLTVAYRDAGGDALDGLDDAGRAAGRGAAASRGSLRRVRADGDVAGARAAGRAVRAAGGRGRARPRPAPA